MKLHTGEMTAQEVRTVRAICAAYGSEPRLSVTPTPANDGTAMLALQPDRIIAARGGDGSPNMR